MRFYITILTLFNVNAPSPPRAGALTIGGAGRPRSAAPSADAYVQAIRVS